MKILTMVIGCFLQVLLWSCEQNVAEDNTNDIETTTLFHKNGVLKSNHVYRGGELLYFDEYDSTGTLVNWDRLADFNFTKVEDSLSVKVKPFGFNHKGRDSSFFSFSRAYLNHEKCYINYRMVLMDSSGWGTISFNLDLDSVYYFRYAFAEFNFEGSKTSDSLAYILNFPKKTVKVDCRNKPITWEYLN
jgi:hypothetical protein